MNDLEKNSFHTAVLGCLRDELAKCIERGGGSPIGNVEWTCRYIDALNAGILALKLQRSEMLEAMGEELWDDD